MIIIIAFDIDIEIERPNGPVHQQGKTQQQQRKTNQILGQREDNMTGRHCWILMKMQQMNAETNAMRHAEFIVF